MNTAQSRSGFTLIDTVASTTALVALVALSAAALATANRADLTAQDQANLMTIGQAAARWSIDHQGLIPGAPGASAREFLHDPSATQGILDSLHTAGLATQPFDWASPLAWGYLTYAPAPERRDERFANAMGIEPKLVDPDAKVPIIADTTAPGALAVLRDPAQSEISIPYDGASLRPAGITNTFFPIQTASSYIAAREFLWWGQGHSTRRWVTDSGSFWGNESGVLTMPSNWSAQLPGGNNAGSIARAYRPYVNRVGNPSKKIYIANGTRFQRVDLSSADHDVSANAPFGGAFADIGAWASDPEAGNTTRAWPLGDNAAGQDMTRISFRHGDETTARGNVLLYDASVSLMDIDDAREPSLWLPRGSNIRLVDIPQPLRDQYEQSGDIVGNHPFVHRALIW